MTRVKWLLLISVVSLLIVSLILAYFKLEWVEKKIDLGPSSDIKRQHFIAAKRLLELDGKVVSLETGYTKLDTFHLNSNLNSDLNFDPNLKPDTNTYPKDMALDSRQDSLPPTNSLIVIPNGYSSMSQARSETLLEWVNKGGRLIVSASNPFLASLDQRSDFIFDYFGVYPAEGQPSSSKQEETQDDASDEALNDDGTNAEDDIQTEPDSQKDVSGSSTKSTKSTKDEDENVFEKWNPQNRCYRLDDNLYLSVYGDVELELGMRGKDALSFPEEDKDNFFYWTSNDQGIQLIQAYHGDGVITFLSDLDLWKNNYIACYDNAYFLRFLAGSSEEVVFLVNRNTSSLVTLTIENFPYLLATLFLFIVFTIWHFAQRFGSIKPKKSLNRRKILEHIDASANFLWRQKKSRWFLVLSVQNKIKSDIKRLTPYFDQKTLAEQHEIIAHRTQLSIEDIQTAMFEITEEIKSQVLTEQNFIVLMKSLKRIEDKL